MEDIKKLLLRSDSELCEIYNDIKKDKELSSYIETQMKISYGEELGNEIIQLTDVAMNGGLCEDKDMKSFANNIKTLMVESIGNTKNICKLVEEIFKPTEYEKNKNAEVITPYELRQEMLDKVPKEFWSNKNHKVFEPACGKFGFVPDIIDRFNEGLKEVIKDDDKRMKHIIENCLYFSDINEFNIEILKLIIDITGNYKLNVNVGDTLELDIKKKWGIESFDLIVGNPPYNIPKESPLKGGYGGRSLWDKFVIYSIDKCLKDNGLLLFVNPPSWRKPEHELWNKMSKENQLLYIKCYTEAESSKIFNCSTIVDYYLLHKKECYKESIIDGQDGVRYKIELKKWDFLPSGSIYDIEKILGKNEVIYSSSIYDPRKKYMLQVKPKESKESYYKRAEIEKYPYKIVHNMTKEYGIGFLYSNENKGHIGIPKVILSHGRHQYPYNDFEGKYGMSCICFGILIKSKEEGDKIVKAINSDKFKKILKYTKWSTFQTDWRMFKYFKKDFYKEF